MRRKFNNWLTAYMEYTKHSEAPDDFHLWTGISTIAGALRRRVWIEMEYFRWTPNFYIVLVAPPGIAQKTTTIDNGMALLREIEDVKFGPQVITWQSLVTEMARSTIGVAFPTNEADELTPMSAMTFASGEFGNLVDPTNREMIDILVSLWDGKDGSFSKSTKTQGSDVIENPWINLIACTTPDWIAGNVPEYMIGGGFTSRTIFLFAEKKRRLVAYPGREVKRGDLAELRADLVHDLRIISERLIGEYTLTEQAFQWGETWYASHFSDANLAEYDRRMGGYVARKQAHIHKLSMVLTAATTDDMFITAETLQLAEQLITQLEKMMPKVFRNIGMSDYARQSEELVTILQNIKGTAPRTQIFSQVQTQMSWHQFNQALEALVQQNLISVGVPKGRSAMHIQWKGEVKTGVAEEAAEA